MKLYRCPHCGNRVFKPYAYFAHKYIRLNDRIAENAYGETKYWYWTMECTECHWPSRFVNETSHQLTVSIIMGLSIIAILYFFLQYIFGIPKLAIAIAVFVGTLCEFLRTIIINRHKSLMPCDPKTHKILDLQPNTRVIINSPKYIKPYGVYGLKFKIETTDKRFHEAFSDGLVPAVFHPNEKGSLAYNVRIINRSFVPDELLFDGAKFLVEDSDGIFIAKGTIEKSNLDY